ncbi:MAG: GNAT family N-acetyltransferase [Clostridiales bacterium]|nr:GNAT family N-acetyltransferase [Clostridiales bacterium]
MTIRRFINSNAKSLSDMIAYTLRTTNIKDYSIEYIENLIAKITPMYLIDKADHTHMYVAAIDDKIVGCGAIGPYYDNADESCLFTIFVSPDYQGHGIGKRIIDTLESDEYFVRAKRIEVPASITAYKFYLKLGYGYKNNNKSLDDDKLIHMEKFRRN